MRPSCCLSFCFSASLQPRGLHNSWSRGVRWADTRESRELTIISIGGQHFTSEYSTALLDRNPRNIKSYHFNTNINWWCKSHQGITVFKHKQYRLIAGNGSLRYLARIRLLLTCCQYNLSAAIMVVDLSVVWTQSTSDCALSLWWCTISSSLTATVTVTRGFSLIRKLR